MSNPPQFIKQEAEPLFPNILYNRPITRTGAGRLLLPGGHSGEFSLPAAIQQLALAAGVGECQVVLPDVLAKFLGGAPGTFFAASTSSGSLGREALGRILELSEEVDAVALGASLSNNSNTTILLDRLIAEIARPLIVFDEALSSLGASIATVTNNPDALIIITMAEAFKICGHLQVPIHIRRDAGLMNKLEIVQDLKAASRCQYVVYGTEIIVAADTELIVTPINYRLSLVPALFYAVLSTFWLQNRTNHRAGLATAAYLISRLGPSIGATDRPAVSDLAAALDQELNKEQF
ncbi:MAG TPA: hypothetical protein VGH44_05855 [Candidatus Saccharimonadia bacterium]